VIELNVRTSKRIEAINITGQVAHAVGGRQGSLLHVYTPHTTCGLLINEQADPDVIKDILAAPERVAPANHPYRHSEGNSDAHIKSVLTGASVSIPFSQGAPRLGTWQGIFFMEFDGPRDRRIIVTLM